MFLILREQRVGKIPLTEGEEVGHMTDFHSWDFGGWIFGCRRLVGRVLCDHEGVWLRTWRGGAGVCEREGRFW